MARKATSTKKSTPRKASSTHKESFSPKQQKPVFRLGTGIAVLVLAVLIGIAFYINRDKEITDAEATSTNEEAAYLFDAEDGNITSIEIKPAEAFGETVKVVRGADNVWVLELPMDAEADQGSVEAAASQITALQVIAEVDGDPETFGLDAPVYVITVGFADGQTHTIEVGDSTPISSGYYVRMDNDKMMIVSLSGIDSLTFLSAFPPYLTTPTPTALPATETPVPPTETISTPEATVTPTP